jgi:glycoprotein endo-alpha-1,2-mannosidase
VKRRSSALWLILIAALHGASCARRVPLQTPQAPPVAQVAQAALVPLVPTSSGGLKKQVLAFYYGWYGNPQVSGSWTHWSDVDQAATRIGNSTNYPGLGAYDSHDPKLVEHHVRKAKEIGITGFIVSWWRQGDFHDKGMPLILETAERAGLCITIYFEDVRPRDAPDPNSAIEDLLYVLDRYGRHPAWLKVNGKPVVFVYSRAVGQLKLPGWQSVAAAINQRYAGGALFVGDQISAAAAQVFDGIHTYNPTGRTAGKSVEEIRAWAHATFPQWIEIAGHDRIACITLIAGFDDSKLGRKEPRPITDRHDGETYRVMWEEAIAANPDWVLICSWNEWHEGSEIEPSAENDGRELKTTAEFAPEFVQLPLRARE